jgi:hypothetical protein
VSYTIIRELLERQLNTVPGNYPTAFENVAYKPSTGTAFQAVTLLPARTQNPSMGDGFKREVGLLQVTVHCPVNPGAQVATARAELIRSYFPRGLTLVSGSVRLLIDESPFINPAMNDGVWYKLPVSIPYIADIQP